MEIQYGNIPMSLCLALTSMHPRLKYAYKSFQPHFWSSNHMQNNHCNWERGGARYKSAISAIIESLGRSGS